KVITKLFQGNCETAQACLPSPFFERRVDCPVPNKTTVLKKDSMPAICTVHFPLFGGRGEGRLSDPKRDYHFCKKKQFVSHLHWIPVPPFFRGRGLVLSHSFPEATFVITFPMTSLTREVLFVSYFCHKKVIGK